MQITELVGIRELRAFAHRTLIAKSPPHTQAAVGGLLDEYRQGMGQAHDERRALLQDTVHLPKDAIEIVDCGKSEDTDHEVDRCVA